MADTIREQIITAFTDRAAPLSGLEIQRCTRSMGETNDYFISVWDGDDNSQPGKYGGDVNQFTLSLHCIWQHGQDNPSVAANALMGEIITTMIGTATDRSFGGLVDKISAVSKQPVYPDDGSDYVTLAVIFLITYTTVAGDPYTQLTP